MKRFHYGKKAEVEDYCKLDIRWLNQNGYLRNFYIGHLQIGPNCKVGIETSVFDDTKYARIWYDQTDRKGKQRSFNEKIFIETTPCRFGGERYWFICPRDLSGLDFCGRRVAVLYLTDNFFGCRHCLNLTYQSRNYGRNPGYVKVKLLNDLDSLIEKTKRRTYASKPTKNTQKLKWLLKMLGRWP